MNLHHPRARYADPDTSHRAAAQAELFSKNHCERILEWLLKNGPSTVDEIAAGTGMDSQQVNKRTPELEREGKIFTMPGRVRKGRSGRLMRVWYAA